MSPAAGGRAGARSTPRDSNGWDGKLRLTQGDEQDEQNEPSPPESENERDVEEVDGGTIEADEGEKSL